MRTPPIRYKDAGQNPVREDGLIHLYDQAAFEAMAYVGALTAACLDDLVDFVRPGITTEEIDVFVREFAQRHTLLPACLYYKGYTKSCCTSINHVICHGIPGKKVLKSGDILNIDVTFIYDGWHGDSSRMYTVGPIKPFARRLLDVTYAALCHGISVVRPGMTTGDIGRAIQNYVEAQDCSVVRDFCGHGIGRLFHDMPNILHYYAPGEEIDLREGMLFTIEPMVNLGRPEARLLSDGWTAVTRDRSLSAQFEHTVGVTKEGCRVFTQSKKGMDYPLSAKEGKARRATER